MTALPGKSFLDDLDRAASALRHLDSSCCREQWVKIGMAAHSAGLTFDDFHSWSATAANYKSESDCRNVWRSFSSNKGISAATLFQLARNQGWSDPAKRLHAAGAVLPARKAPVTLLTLPENTKAIEIWNRCKPAPATHPYIIMKKGTPDGLRVYPHSAPPLIIQGENTAGYLTVPCWSNGALQTLQLVSANGRKLNLAGAQFNDGFFTVGEIAADSLVYICEGLGQAWACNEATGNPAVVSFGAGRMGRVTAAVRALHPGARLIIVPDRAKETQAAAIANTVGCEWCVLPEEKPDNYDVGDYRAELGPEALAELLQNPKAAAQGVSATRRISKISIADIPWPIPKPLADQREPLPYPVNSLPKIIREAVMEVEAFTQAPTAMVAGAALSTLSIAAQGYCDVSRADKLSGPISIFSLSLADSGERKSSCDGFFKRVITDFEAEKADLAKPKIARYKADHAIWESVRVGLLDRIKSDAKAGKPTHETENILHRHQAEEPTPPVVPRLLYNDFTPEKLTYNLAKVYPIGGILSSEAGAVFGSHAMTGDSLMRTLSILNQLWDGATLTYDRRTSGSYVVKGARLSMALQIQPAALQQFVDKSGGLARGIGFFARFLLAWPKSTQGNRFFRAAPPNWPALEKYHQQIRKILDVPVRIDDCGGLIVEMLTLSMEAKQAWINFHDDVELELSQDGELVAIRDTASKIADNAVRIAALFHISQSRTGPITAGDFNRASMVAGWHLHEALRFFSTGPTDSTDQAIQTLDAWLIKNCAGRPVSMTAVMHHGPNPTRQKAALSAALAVLAERGRVQLREIGRTTEIIINPALLGGDQ